MTVVPAAFMHPMTGTRPRRPMSIRRTSHIDMIFPGPRWGGPLRLRGGARDLFTGPGGAPEVLSEAHVDADLDDARRLRSLVVQPDEPAVMSLIGSVVGPGFRAALADTRPDGASSASPLSLLLDDLPVAALISGYAALYDTDTPRPGGGMLRADICSGWRSDGTMMLELSAGRPMPIPVGPLAPPLEPPDDPFAWHRMDALERHAMRRRRLIDVAAGDPLVVSAMFRDSHRNADGAETILHEYSLEAAVDPATLQVLRCDATPQSLPWEECPHAASSASRLQGCHVGELRDYVRANLQGTSTCTHLNDLLRSLAAIAALAPALTRKG